MQISHFVTAAKLATLCIILLLIPLSALSVPKNQMEIQGFDPKLVDIDKPIGVTLNASMLILDARMNEATPLVTTITTPSSFKVSFDATVIKQQGSCSPFQVWMWDPSTNDVFSVYLVSPGNQIRVCARHLLDVPEAKVELDSEIGKYAENSPYNFQLSFFTNSYIELQVSNSTWSNTERIQNVTILTRPMVSLSFYSRADQTESISVLQNYKVEVPSQDYYNFFTSLLGDGLIWVYIALFSLILVLWRSDFIAVLNQTVGFLRSLSFKMRQHNKEMKLLSILFSLSILLQLSLSFVGSQPYDSYAQKTWAYINSKQGLAYLYPLSLILPSGRSVGTFSLIDLVYPYPPLLGYVYFGIGQIYARASPSFDFNNPFFGLLMKTPWILATTVLGLLIYYFLRKTSNSKVALVLTSLYIFNPSVIAESVIWSQSDAILASLLILSVLALRSGSTRGVWFFLGLSLLTKQTAVVPAAFISIFALWKFGILKTLKSLVFPFVCIFLLVGPYLLLGYSPSFIFNVSIGQNVLSLFMTTPLRVPSWQLVASNGAHNIWPLLTRILDYRSGWERFAYPDFLSNQILGTSFVRFGTYLVLICFVLILAQFLVSEELKNAKESPAFYTLFLAVLSLFTFFTRIHPRYLYLTIPFLLLSYNWIKNKKIFVLLFGTLTSTFFFSVYSYFTLTSVWQPAYLPNFSPNANFLNLVMFQFITNDEFITVLCLVNLALFITAMSFSSLRIFGNAINFVIKKMVENAKIGDETFSSQNSAEQQDDSRNHCDGEFLDEQSD